VQQAGIKSPSTALFSACMGVPDRILQWGSLLVALVFLNGSICPAGELVTDEAIRLRVLHLAFPNARISVLPVQPDEKPYSVTDPLGRVIALVKNGLQCDHEYDVVGPLAKNEEQLASDITHPEHSASDKRQLRMQLYHWRVEDGEPLLVAVLSYSFPDANPPRCCRAEGRILLLSSTADRILSALDKVPYAFTMFTSIRFLDVQGTGAEQMMIAADFSGVGTIGIDSVVFIVSDERLKPLISLTTMLLSETDTENLDIHTLTLDDHQTLLAQGKRFVFTKKKYAEKGKIFRKPVTSKVSYPVGSGLPLDWQ
jgi:hypothetical protein